jgi:hypothetical protein
MEKDWNDCSETTSMVGDSCKGYSCSGLAGDGRKSKLPLTNWKKRVPCWSSGGTVKTSRPRGKRKLEKESPLLEFRRNSKNQQVERKEETGKRESLVGVQEGQ